MGGHLGNHGSPRAVGKGCCGAVSGRKCRCPRKTAGTGQDTARQLQCGRPRVAIPVPAASFRSAYQGKSNESRRQGEFTATDSNYNIRQFVLRCYCAFPVLITNYGSITPTWQFICSCLCSGRLGDGPLISPFHFSARSARRLSSADTEEVRHCCGRDNCT